LKQEFLELIALQPECTFYADRLFCHAGTLSHIQSCPFGLWFCPVFWWLDVNM